jgi:hypothetical protein
MDNLQEVFNQLKPLLQTFAPPLKSKVDDDKHFDLWTTKETIIQGRKFPEVYFAAVMINKSYVSLHYMPIYADPESKKLIKPELLAKLSGKSCFNFKKLDSVLLEQIEETLTRGFKEYQKRGWV